MFKTVGYSLALTLVAAVYSVCGYTYAAESIEPELIPVEVPIEVPHAFQNKLVIAISEVGEAVEYDGGSLEGIAYLLTVSYDDGGMFNAIETYVPFPDGNYLVITLRIPSSHYDVQLDKVGEPLPMAMEDGDNG